MTNVAMKAGKLFYDYVLSYFIPKKKTVIRALLFALFAFLPILLILLIKLPHIILPFFAVIFGVLYALGAGEEFLKQLRWMKRMSGRGPIFWALAYLEKLSVQWMRRFYGESMDVLPKAVKAVGTEMRGAEKAKIKWIPTPTSIYSTELYEVEIRATPPGSGPPSDDAADASAAGFVSLSQGLAEDNLLLKPLKAGFTYEARVRATNSKGPSDWKVCRFTTKLLPIRSEDGERAGGSGDGYTWLQHLKDESLVVTVGPLPASTRSKQLEIKVTPTAIAVRLDGKDALCGELFGSIQPDEVRTTAGARTVPLFALPGFSGAHRPSPALPSP